MPGGQVDMRIAEHTQLRSRHAGPGEALDRFNDATEAVAAVWGEVLGDPDFTEKIRIGRGDFFRPGLTVKVAEQGGDAFDNGGVGLRLVVAASLLEFWDHPELRHTAFDFETVDT